MPATRFAKRILPTPESLQRRRGLRALGRYLEHRPWLWVAHRRRVALGAALGVGLGVLPLPSQMVLAAVAAILFRVNAGAAVAATWLTNPLTLVPIWSFAVFLGRLVLPGSPQVSEVSRLDLNWTQPLSWLPQFGDWLLSLGPPLMVGLPMAGVVLGTATYFVVFWAWWALISLERWRRLSARKRRREASDRGQGNR